MSAIIGRAVRGSAGLAVAALVFAAPAFADDAGVRQRIETRMNKAGLAERGQIEVNVTSGAAVLSGFTLTVDGQRAAEKAARKETKTVENRLRVVPAEKKTDAEVQKAVADAILGYVHYGVFDSVGVGVDDGVVTLVGSVYQPWRRMVNRRPDAFNSASVSRCSSARLSGDVSAWSRLVYTIRFTPWFFAAAMTLWCWTARWPTSLDEISSSVLTPASA